MYISNKDLEFLIELENELGCSESWSDRVKQLWSLNEKLIKQREKQQKKTREYIAERRKTDKNYARTQRQNKKGKTVYW